MTLILTGPSDPAQADAKLYQIATAIEYRAGFFAPPKLKVLKAWGDEASKADHPIARIWTAWQAFTHRPGEILRGRGVKLLPNEYPHHLGHFQDSPENRRVWARIQDQAQAIGAAHILLETPPTFSPARANQEKLTAFVREWAQLREGLALIWRPSGFWEREESVALTQELGITLAFDPLIDQKEALPSQSLAYFQMLGRHGLLDSYSDDDLEFILDKAQNFDTALVLFRTREALADCLRLQQIATHFVPFEHDFDEMDEDDFDEEDDFEDEDDDFEDEDFDEN